MSNEDGKVKGRFAPSPTGRMHLGNLFTALLSWLSVRSQGGRWLLRIEDLDPQRSRTDYARLIEDDLRWLGLDWDEGGLEEKGPAGSYRQSERGDVYEEELRKLREAGLVYPCTCRRADLHASDAPHASDGRFVYGGRCRPQDMPRTDIPVPALPHSLRLLVPDEDVTFTDGVFGEQRVNLAREFGDFVVRRADGAWAYQLAVVADDAWMGVTEVVRGCDLMSSSAPQIYLHRLLGSLPPRFIHVPLLCNAAGVRLSKRDASLSMDALRKDYTPEQLTGYLANLAGLIPDAAPIAARDLVDRFDWRKVPVVTSIRLTDTSCIPPETEK